MAKPFFLLSTVYIYVYVVFIYNNLRLMIQMNTTKKNLTKLDLYPGQVVR